jgi:nuclear pore complex protein Nup50
LRRREKIERRTLAGRLTSTRDAAMGKKRRSEPDDDDEWGAGARALAAQGGTAEDKAKREDKCRAHLRALNKQFSDWVQSQIGSRPVKSWAAGCQDYLKHIAQIKAGFKDVLETAPGAAKPAAASAPAPLFGGAGGIPAGTPMKENPLFAAPSPATGDKPAAPPLFAGFGGASAAAAAPAAAAPSLFPNAASNPFSGGSAAPPPSLFGGSAPAPAPAFGGFGGFGGAPAPAAAGGGEEDDEEEQRPPSPSVKETDRGEDDAEESLLKCECKYFAKAAVADAWGDRGKNTLEFLREKEASSNGVHRSRIVLRTSIGKAVLNAGLYKNMSVQVTEKKNPDGSMKKNGIIVQLFNAVEDSAKTIALLRFSKEETVLQLQKLLEENVKAMS